MMRKQQFRHILSLAMIGLIMFSGLPLFVSEDANHDRRIDIKDAVIKLQITSHQTKSQSMAACEDTLEAVAGIKEIVPPDFETDQRFSSTFCFLVPNADINPVFLDYGTISINRVLFSSITSPPSHQPPIFS